MGISTPDQWKSVTWSNVEFLFNEFLDFKEATGRIKRALDGHRFDTEDFFSSSQDMFG